MAARDHSDLQSRSQDISSYFLNHFLNQPHPWYIKDEQSKYIISNQSVSKLYGIDDFNLNGQTDKDLGILTPCFQMFNYECERRVINNNREVSALILDKFNGEVHLSPRIFTIQPFNFGKKMTITFVSPLCQINVNASMESLINPDLDCKKISPLSLDRPLNEYAYINPLKEGKLTEKQWEVAWLVLIGFSYRKISRIKKIAPKNVSALSSKAFENLGVYSLNEFLFVGSYYSWLDYIPPSLLNSPSATSLSVYRISSEEQKGGIQVLPFAF